ncbi:hypothetical protein ABK040_007914 [Willaertia magna]
MSGFFNWLFGNDKKNVEKELDKKRKMLRLTEEQIKVQEESYETLTETIDEMKDNLERIREREKEMIELQEQTLKELEEDYEQYLKKEQKDEIYENKYNLSKQFLIETMAQKRQEIKSKIEAYESKIEKLEKRREELLHTQKLTENNSKEINEEVDRLEKLRLGTLPEDLSSMHETEDLEASLITSATTIQPREDDYLYDDYHEPIAPIEHDKKEEDLT